MLKARMHPAVLSGRNDHAFRSEPRERPTDSHAPLRGKWPALLRSAPLALAAIAAPSLTQVIDTALFREDDSRFTVLDQAETEAERRALKALLKEPDPQLKSALAENFLSAFPASASLAAVYDVAARTAIDLGELGQGVARAEASLRILPENPLLLAALADAYAAQEQHGRAATTAREALRHLDRLKQPSLLSPTRWASLERQLRASCYLVLGKSTLARSFRSTGASRTQLVRQAVELLTRSRSFDRDHAQGAYLLGIALGLLQQQASAARNLADAYRLGGALQVRARRELRKLHRAQPPADRKPFEEFMQNLPPARIRAGTAKTTKPGSPAARYAGSDSCRDCHAATFDAWKQTGMARMFRAFKPEHVLGDFGSRLEFKTDDGVAVGRVGTQDGRPYMEFRDSHGRWQRHLVDYVIGSKWQQAYATELADGRIQVFPVQYNLLDERWLNFWRVIDPPGTERARLRDFHRMSRATNYQVHCASCHTSQLSRSRDRHPRDFVWRESGVNCEMCHGPAADHVAAAQAGQPLRQSERSMPLRLADLSAEQYVNLCGRCHMQSNLFDLGPQGEINFTGLAIAFFPAYKGRPINEFSQQAFHRDGRFRETTFIGESLVRSACYRVGGAHCGSCHDPHPANPGANPSSLKFPDDPDRMCLQCHQRFAVNPALHARHAPESPGSRCTSCHMPRIMHALGFNASTHRIDDIPDAAGTLRYGQADSPNACLLCHKDRDPTWAQQQLVKLYRSTN